jgi:hypothetical protein
MVDALAVLCDSYPFPCVHMLGGGGHAGDG